MWLDEGEQAITTAFELLDEADKAERKAMGG